MMPPAMRKAARLMPSAREQILAEQAEEEQDAGGDQRPSGSPSRGGAPAARRG